LICSGAKIYALKIQEKEETTKNPSSTTETHYSGFKEKRKEHRSVAI
jgi:hypothetical protein